jgi:agmatine deiminase
VYVTHPHNPLTWPDRLTEAQQQFEAFVHTLRQYVDVTSTQELNIPTDDSWIRDYGPIFVVNQSREIACHDFIFNCWGGKYRPFENDDVVPQHVAALREMPIWIHDVVLEGGSIEVNGRGTVMTTEQCLLNPNRNPRMDQQDIENILHETLGTSHVIWLPGGIEGDDTDGHIDDVARFIREDVVAAVRAPSAHGDHELLERNWEVLRMARTEQGRRLNLVELPAPAPMSYDFPADEFGPASRRPVPASYANFLIANEAVLVPTFDQPMDDVALRRMEQAMPDHRIVPVRSEHLVVGLGGLHCLSMQQPAAA